MEERNLQNIDLSDTEFFEKYIELSSELSTNDVLERGAKLDFGRIFGRVA